MASVLPTAQDCCNVCDCPETTTVPGPQGDDGPQGDTGVQGAKGDTGTVGSAGPKGDTGSAGVSGTNGQNAFTVTTANFTQPAEGATVNIEVVSSAWIAGGQHLYVTGGGDYLVTAIPDATHVTIRNLENTGSNLYPDNAAPGATINAGAAVSPGGIQGPAGVSGSTPTLAYGLITDQGTPPFAPQAFAYTAWTTKRLTDPSGSVVLSLLANQFILATGTYLVDGILYAEQCYMRTRIRNITDGATLLQGTQTRTLNNSGSILAIHGIITTTSAKTLEWQYYATNDGGGAANLGFAMSTGDPEIYARLRFVKIS